MYVDNISYYSKHFYSKIFKHKYTKQLDLFYKLQIGQITISSKYAENFTN